MHISKKEHEHGKRYIPTNMQVHLFEGEYGIDNQIKIIEWGGHSKGSAMVEIQTYNIVHVLTGDECYTNANMERKLCTGTYCNKEKSTEFIKKFCTPKYRVHTCHDISLKTERII